MNLLIIAKSNIKKNKNMTATLVILIILATILLYIGASIILEMNHVIDNKNKDLNGSDFTVYAPEQYENTLQNILSKTGKYEQLEKERAVSGAAKFKNLTMKGKSQSMDCLILNADNKETISKLKLINEGEKRQENSIILPYYLKVAQGYRTGDKITISYEGKTHSFTVYGFSEDIMFAIPSNLSCYKCYVYEEEFNKLYNESDNTKYFMLRTLLPEGADTQKYSDRYLKEMNKTITDTTSSIVILDYSGMKVGASIFLIIIMVILIVFSAIIILIALTVIRFAVVTYIEGNMKNIGSMEALGYTGRELVAGTVLQFALIALISNILGLVAAVSLNGIVTRLVSSSIGLAWNGTVNLTAIAVNVFVIMLSVISISYFTSARMKRITPITALRDGINTHNFKKNHFPLDKTCVSVDTAIGLKTMVQNMKQNITVFIIVTLMAFVCVFSFTADFNMIVNNKALLRLIGLENSQLLVKYPDKDSIRIFDEIDRMAHVKKTIRLTRNSMTLYMGDKETTPAVNVCNAYKLLNIKTIVRGRYPVHDNEIAVSGLVLKQLKAKLGDAVTMKGNESRADFIIVGIVQQINNLGKGACITEDGMLRVNPDYIPSSLYVHLDNSDSISGVTKAINARYGETGLTLINMEDQFSNILSSFTNAINALCIACIIITLLIISLVLYLLIKIKLIKERIHIGIAKALGYTTKQIILQVVLSFFPVCLLGAFCGTVLAMLFINPVLAGLLSVAGSIQNCHFYISPVLAVITFLAINSYAVMITALISWSARKITPCELFM